VLDRGLGPPQEGEILGVGNGRSSVAMSPNAKLLWPLFFYYRTYLRHFVLRLEGPNTDQ